MNSLAREKLRSRLAKMRCYGFEGIFSARLRAIELWIQLGNPRSSSRAAYSRHEED